ncbi:MAG: DUF1722 domain-containing protein [Candidatus Krumholzibacteriota bacterium]|nr:DUF1722 domain-containing protein [Candidatus Krumholzibacteriota bacterium]
MKKIRPVIVVSECLGFSACRYDGKVVSAPFIKRLGKYVDFIPVCPEVAIALGTPRDTIRIVEEKGSLRLLQPSTGRDLTTGMIDFSDRFLERLEKIDGFILKSRSPSCGPGGVKIYSSPASVSPGSRGSGFFASSVLSRFGHLPIEDETRLDDLRLREHFLTRIFTMARFRVAASSGKAGAIARFHEENNLLLTSYNAKEKRSLETVLSDHDGRTTRQLMEDYGRHLNYALRRPSRYTSNINILLHAMSYFSYTLTHEEKGFFLESMERYREKKMPLSSLLLLLRVWIARFKTADLRSQTYFSPYPEGLVHIKDSVGGKNCL